MAAVRGVNPPELEKNIVEKLKQEHEVMKGETERVEVIILSFRLKKNIIILRLDKGPGFACTRASRT